MRRKIVTVTNKNQSGPEAGAEVPRRNSGDQVNDQEDGQDAVRDTQEDLTRNAMESEVSAESMEEVFSEEDDLQGQQRGAGAISRPYNLKSKELEIL